MQLTYGMYATMGLEGAIGNATDSGASVVRIVIMLTSRTLWGDEGEHDLSRGSLMSMKGTTVSPNAFLRRQTLSCALCHYGLNRTRIVTYYTSSLFGNILPG